MIESVRENFLSQGVQIDSLVTLIEIFFNEAEFHVGR